MSSPGRSTNPVEDGPGGGRHVDVIVRAMVGTKRATVFVERRGEPACLAMSECMGA
jgi:hypothetical protein